MKRSITRTLAFSALGLLACATHVCAQTSAFTYQGSLTQNGQPASGTYDFMFRLINAPTDGTAAPVIPMSPGVGVTNGLFTTGIDFGVENLNGANLWLEISVRTNGGGAFTTLAPRQLLTSAPYAVTAVSVSASGISGTYGNAVTFNNAANSFAGNGAGLTILNATALTQGTVPAAALDNAWKIGGNAGTMAGTHFVGTTDNQAVEIWVNGLRAGRFEPSGDSHDPDLEPDGAPNVILGSPANLVTAGTVGATIGGGGATNSYGQSLGNLVEADFSTIAGGISNFIRRGAESSIIAGGYGNELLTDAYASTISGGQLGRIHELSSYCTISGGYGNLIGPRSSLAMIVGGMENMIGTNANSCMIGGGRFNKIQSLDAPDFTHNCAIVGGYGNQIGISSDDCFIGGGGGNKIGQGSEYVSLVGGRNNRIEGFSQNTFIGGGHNNLIDEGSRNSVVVGGQTNRILGNSGCGVISGGYENQITGAQAFVLTGGAPVIAGGAYNRIETNSSWSAIGGGFGNLVLTNSQYATIPGGRENTATNFALAAGFRAKAIHVGSFVWADSTGGNLESALADSITLRASGGYRLFSNAATNTGVSLAPNATAWSVISDRAMKKDFAAVDGREVLEKLAAVPVQSWHYQWESADATPHLGPVAQDFKAAFYPGRDDKSITTLEFDGVALAAIQGLNQKLEAELQRRDVENTELKQQNAELLKRLEAIEARLK